MTRTMKISTKLTGVPRSSQLNSEEDTFRHGWFGQSGKFGIKGLNDPWARESRRGRGGS